MRSHVIFWVLLWACAGLRAQSLSSAVPDATALVQQAYARGLERHPQWLRLLHASAKTGVSEVVSPDFFVKPDSDHHARSEMRETLVALMEPMGVNAAGHARCRFPARHQWLAQQLNFHTGTIPDQRCTDLNTWRSGHPIQTVSLLLVSGYFGNPASTFGHALLRFGSHGDPGGNSLLDVSLNFGALVPEDVNMLSYIYKGVFGGYHAGFSDKDFYANDLVYSRTENRDMWSYELNLTPAQIQLLALHVWEISGKKFDYYFLNKNCAWRLADLIDLALDQTLRPENSPWYLPVEYFHRLEALNGITSLLLQPVQFIPSYERTLVARLGALNKANQALFEHQVGNHVADLDAQTENVSPPERLALLDALLAYYTWKAPGGDGSTLDPVVVGAKKRVMLARLQYPAQAASRVADVPIPSPATGTPPMLWAGGLRASPSVTSTVMLEWSPVSYESGGHHGIEGGEMSVADLRAQINAQGDAELDAFTLLKIRKLHARRPNIPGEDGMSWQVDVAWQREGDVGATALRPHAAYGLGYAHQFTAQGLQGYGLLNVGAIGTPSAVYLEPLLGALWRAGPWSTAIEVRKRFEDNAKAPLSSSVLNLHYRWGYKYAIKLEASFSDRPHLGMLWQWYQ